MDYRKFKELNEDIISIRRTVFEKEQGFQNEFDEIDQNCSHIVLYDNDKPVAVCRFCNIQTQIALIKTKSDIVYFKSPIIVLSVQVSEIRTNSDYDLFFR